MKRKRGFLSRSPAPTLMLTSLLDMFTIILIFLIVSFESEDQGFELSEQVKLPESSARGELKQAVNVVITHDRVLIDDQAVAKVTDRRDAGEAGQSEIPGVVDALEAQYRARFGEPGEVEDVEAVVVIQSDRQIDYDTLYAVLRSAAAAGFYKYRLAVLKS